MEDRITAEAIEAVLADWPQLTYFGFRSPDSDNYGPERAELLGDRAIAEIQFSCDWLRSAKLTAKAGPKSPLSYWVKHVVERVRGDYVSNGSLIVAALLAGVSISRPEGPNARVAVNRRWLDKVPQ